MRRTGKRSESPYNEANTTDPAVQGVYNYRALCTNTPEDPGRLHGWIGQSFDLAANASQS